MIDRKYFFDEVRRRLSGGHLTQSQVDGFEFLLGKIDETELDPRWSAYMLATAWHETGLEMQPNSEKGSVAYFARKKYGHQWRGRGYVHLTWYDNYVKFRDLIGVDIVSDPDKALDQETAWKIMLVGMVKGLFTGVGLEKYFNDEVTRWSAARAIINGTDCADKIAGYATIIFDAMKEAA